MTVRKLPALMVLAVAMLLMVVAAAPAQAAPGYEVAGEFGSAELPAGSQDSTGPRIAVDDVTGDVLVASYHRFVSPPGVFVFSSSGASLGLVGAGSVNAGGIAIDQTNGDLYVADTQSGRILRYTTDRANPPTYTLDVTYDGPAQGSNFAGGQIGNLASAIAIDPTNRDLLVADNGGLQVDRYGPDGTFLGSFDGAGTEAGKFTSLLDLAVDAGGRIYVVQNGAPFQSNNIYRGPVLGSSVARFAPDGSGGALIAPGETLSEARAIGVDTATGRFSVITGGAGFIEGEPLGRTLALWTFTSAGAFASSQELAEPAAKSVTGGIAINPSSGQLYTGLAQPEALRGTNGVQVFNPQAVPGVGIGAPANLTPSAAQFRGTVTPVGKVTRYHFEYSSDDGITWTPTPTEETATGAEDPVAVSADVTLEPARPYKVRLVAEDGDGSNLSQMFSFSAPPAAPMAVTGIASAIETGQAHVQGTVNPEGSQATYHFEYGTTTSYGSRAPAFDATAGTGRKPIPVGVDLTNLAPGTVYHYRLVADSPGGEGTGEDRTFETPLAPPPARAFELVSSPAEKANVSVETSYMTGLATVDGNGMLFGTQKSTYPGAEATPYIPRVSAFRTDQGWKTINTDPPQYNEVRGQNAFIGTLAVSADQTRAVVVSKAALASGAVAGQPNMYIRDLRTDQFEFVATGQLGNSGGEGDAIFGLGAPEAMIGGSADLSTIAFMGGLKVTGPNYGHSQAIANQNIYEWNEESGLSLLPILPDGSVSPLRSLPPNNSIQDPNQVSTDGKRIYFATGESTNTEGGLYLREGGKSTLVSVSHIPGDPKVPVPAGFIAASANGRYVIFQTTFTHALTPDVPSERNSESLVYRYDAETGELTYLTQVTSVYTAQPQTGELYYKLFSSNGLYHFHDGVSTRIADEPEGTNYIAVSPNGRYFAFTTLQDLTTAGTSGVEELYLYDSKTGQLTCPSCRTDGKSPTGPPRFGALEGRATGVNRQYPRAVLDDGTVFFDSPDPLVPGDSNGERDVYSYRDGRTTLISQGNHSGGSEFVEATPDGSNVFLATVQQLVPQDDDHAVDLYDARVGGGFAAAEGGLSEACGDGCVSAAPPGPVNGSETTPATPKPKKAKAKKTKPKHCPKQKVKKGGRTKAQCHQQGGSKKKSKNHSKKGAGR